MKRLLLSLGLFLSLVRPGSADINAGDSFLVLQGGAGSTDSDFDLNGPEKRPVTAVGGAYGAQFVHFIKASPAIAVGVDGMGSLNSTYKADDLIGGFNSEHRMKSAVFMAIAKLAYPKGMYRPYIFGGMGGHSSSLFLSAQPRSGSTWSGGGTDNRVLVDEHKGGFAFGYGIGMDLHVNDNVFLGFELRGTFLGGLRRRRTDVATASGIVIDNERAVTQHNLLMRLGYRFGK